jgi:hypothetical protein
MLQLSFCKKEDQKAFEFHQNERKEDFILKTTHFGMKTKENIMSIG